MDHDAVADLLSRLEIEEYFRKFRRKDANLEDMIDFLYLIINQSGLPMASLMSEFEPNNSVYVELKNGAKFRLKVEETEKFI